MKALLLVDIQNDFLPGGALAVDEGDQIIPIVNELIKKFDLILATQDWHPADHGSFAANHENRKAGDIIELTGLDQILWPVHCVQESRGARFSDQLDIESILHIVKKGTDKKIDSYSGFFDNGHLKSTGLDDYLKDNGVNDLYITGLATDYCVKFTALDAISLGYNTWLIADATRAVNLQPNDFKNAVSEMESAGVNVIESKDIL